MAGTLGETGSVCRAWIWTGLGAGLGAVGAALGVGATLGTLLGGEGEKNGSSTKDRA